MYKFYLREMLFMKKIITKIFSRIKGVLETQRMDKDKIPSIKMAMFSGSIKRVK